MGTILNFRRGSTIPKLTTSEPFWKTNDNVLIIGNDGKEKSHIVLVKLDSINSGSLYISDNLEIGGKLIVGGHQIEPFSKNGLISGSDQLTSSLDGRYISSDTVISGSQQLPTGLVSGSSQVSYTGLSNIPKGILSGSKIDISQLNIFTSSISSIIDNISSKTGSYITKLPTDIISGSSQLTGSLDTRYIEMFNRIHTSTKICPFGQLDVKKISTNSNRSIIEKGDRVINSNINNSVFLIFGEYVSGDPLETGSYNPNTLDYYDPNKHII